MDISELTEAEISQMTWLMRATSENPWYGLYAYIAIIILGFIVFKLGFARELPIFKRIIIYILLVIGCFIFWLMEFAFGAPMMLVLLISAIYLSIYRFRLHLHRKKNMES